MKTLPFMSALPIGEDKQAKLNDSTVISLGLQNGATHWPGTFHLLLCHLILRTLRNIYFTDDENVS